MKSKSDRRLPKFPPLPVSGPPVQTNPLVWDVRRVGLPYWLNVQAMQGKAFKPFYSTGALNEALRDQYGAFQPPAFVEMDKQEIVEVRARANPWHPSGRLEKLVLRQWIEEDPKVGSKTFLNTTLKFHGDGEQIECISVFKTVEFKTRQPSKPAQVTFFAPKYKGPRQPNDTKSAVSGNKRKP